MESGSLSMKELWISMARKSVRELKAEDFRDENGLAVCGICGKPMECIRTKYFNGEAVPLVFGIQCDCEKAESKAKAEAEARDEATKKIERLRNLSLMDKRLADARFESCDVTAENQRVVNLCKRYVAKWEQMEESNQGLLFWGLPGTGKSHMSACIANALLERGVFTVMTSCIRLTDLILNGDETEMAILGRINRASLLILDDIGAERMTDYAIERVYSIVDSRYRACKPLIVTTNLPLDQIRDDADPKMGRIYSRILEMCYPIHCTGKFRRKAAAERYNLAKELLEEG